MIRLISLLNKILMERSAKEQAIAMGLVHAGWGRWKNPTTGVVSHKTKDDRLVPISNGDNAKIGSKFDDKFTPNIPTDWSDAGWQIELPSGWGDEKKSNTVSKIESLIVPSFPNDEPPSDESVLHKQVGGQRGSNPGGFYVGTDGKTRYVKFYENKKQAIGEQISNVIYSSLGIKAPSSFIYSGTGSQKITYASDVIHGATTLGRGGLTKNRARKIIDGFVADVLLANWDVIGLEFDNIVYEGDSDEPIRLDNGGSLLTRAMGGDKPENLLDDIKEISSLRDVKQNKNYYEVFEKADYSNQELFELIVDQVKDIEKLRNDFGGWDNFMKMFNKHQISDDVGNTTDAYQSRIVAMLDARTDKLVKLVRELEKRSRVRTIQSKDDLNRKVYNEKLPTPDEFDAMWNSPSNELYGPVGVDPKLKDYIVDGNIADTPIIGRTKDIEVDESELSYIFGALTRDDIRSSPTYDDQLPLFLNRVSEEAKDYYESSILGNLAKWCRGVLRNKLKFTELVDGVLPKKINTGQVLLRGLDVSNVLFHEFIQDFRIGEAIQFPMAYSFTGKSRIASSPTFAGETVSSNVSVILRMHPNENKQHSVYDVQSIRKTYEKLVEQNEDKLDEEFRDKLKSSIRDIEIFTGEDELLSVPGTAYEVLGMTRMTASVWVARPLTPRRERRSKRYVIIDIRELENPINEESKHPNKISTKPIGKVAQYLLNQPLNPKKNR